MLKSSGRITRQGLSIWLLSMLGLALSLVAGFVHAQGMSPSSLEKSETYEALANVLDDPETRDQLIVTLRQLASGERPPSNEEGARSESALSAVGEKVAGTALEQTQALTQALSRLAVDPEEGQRLVRLLLSPSVLSLLAIVVATLVFQSLYRRARLGLFKRIAPPADVVSSTGGLFRRSLAILGALTIDAGTVFAAWLTGYVLIVLTAITLPETVGAGHTLFLTAFPLVEGARTLIRRLFSPETPLLRGIPVADEDAQYWSAWLDRLTAFTGYSLLLLVPLIESLTVTNIGAVLETLILLITTGVGLLLVVRNRAPIRDNLQRAAARQTLPLISPLLHVLAPAWHVLASVYILALFLIGLVRPEGGLRFLAIASAQTLAAILVAGFLTLLLTRLSEQRLVLGTGLRQQVPSLESRLNASLQPVMTGLRLLILALLAGVLMDAWTPFSLPAWFASDSGLQTSRTIVSVLLILLLASIGWLGVSSWIEHRLNPDNGRGPAGAREKTLLALFRNALAIALVIITGMVVLSELGIDIGPLIAGAGVIGLAIGFGSQKLVQDIITGVFIQLESAINAGDVVTVAGITGTAEKLTIRSIGLRDLNGTFHLIPFSSVGSVSNYMRDHAFHTGVYGIAYRDDIDTAKASLEAAFEELRAMPEQAAKLLAPLEMHGVVELGDSAVKLRVRIKTRPGDQWAVGRLYNELVKKHFDRSGIDIPFPHTTVYFGNDQPAAIEHSTSQSIDRKQGKDVPT